MTERHEAGARLCEYRHANNKPCKNWAMRGTFFCRWHQQTSADVALAAERVNQVRNENIAALEAMRLHSNRIEPAVLIDAYEDLLPDGLKERYVAILRSDVLNLTEEAAILELRIQESLRLLDKGGYSALWQRLWDKRTKLIEISQRLGNPNLSPTEQQRLQRLNGQLSKELFNIIDQGKEQGLLWEEISLAIENKRRIVETERKRIAAAGQFISQQDAANLFLKFQSAVETHVDPQTLGQIYATFDAAAHGDTTYHSTVGGAHQGAD